MMMTAQPLPTRMGTRLFESPVSSPSSKNKFKKHDKPVIWLRDSKSTFLLEGFESPAPPGKY